MAMLRFRAITLLFCSISLFLIISGFAKNGYGNGKSGEALFKQHCEVCHPNGGNIMNPKKTLSKKDREANGVISQDAIVHYMRKPGPGMTTFNEKAIPEKSANEIAEFILKAFK
jgi:cytochrome c6